MGSFTIIFYKKLNYISSKKINIKNAYIIHFRFKSAEELIYKYKRGFRNWFRNKTNIFLKKLINDFFIFKKITIEKIRYIEKELNLSLSGDWRL